MRRPHGKLPTKAVGVTAICMAVTGFVALLAGLFTGRPEPYLGGGSALLGALLVPLLYVGWRNSSLPPALARLAHESDDGRAVEGLLAMGPRAVPLLLSALPDVQLGGFWSFADTSGVALRARRRAIDALGRLRAPEAVEPLIAMLGSADEATCGCAIRALAAIGDSRAVPALIPWLVTNNRPGAIDTAATAVEALDALGQSRLVRRFNAVLGGHLAQLDALMADHRAAVVQALILALDHLYPARACAAARALAKLGAAEALPELRAKVAAHSYVDARVKTACGDAAAQLEGLVALPRMASQPQPGIEALPRSAGQDPPEATAEAEQSG